MRIDVNPVQQRHTELLPQPRLDEPFVLTGGTQAECSVVPSSSTHSAPW